MRLRSVDGRRMTYKQQIWDNPKHSKSSSEKNEWNCGGVISPSLGACGYGSHLRSRVLKYIALQVE